MLAETVSILPYADDYLTSGNGCTAIAVLLEHRFLDDAKLIDVVCDGSFGDLWKTVRSTYGHEWAIADSWDVRDESTLDKPVYIQIAA